MAKGLNIVFNTQVSLGHSHNSKFKKFIYYRSLNVRSTEVVIICLLRIHSCGGSSSSSLSVIYQSSILDNTILVIRAN